MKYIATYLGAGRPIEEINATTDPKTGGRDGWDYGGDARRAGRGAGGKRDAIGLLEGGRKPKEREEKII